MDKAFVSGARSGETTTVGRSSTGRATWVGSLALLCFLGAILVFGIYFRTVGRNWDEGQTLHPDERFLTMVTTAVQPVRSLGEYFDTAKSQLNPYNKGFGSFVYGTLPLFIVRYTAEFCRDCSWLQAYLGVKGPLTGYGEINQLGRFLSSVFDLAALVVLYWIARRLYDTRVAVLATALAAFSVLNIQQSHYYTADTFANFFAILTVFFAVLVLQRGKWYDYVGLGLFFGTAIGSRINLLTLAGIIFGVLVVKVIDAWRGMREVDQAPPSFAGKGAGGLGPTSPPSPPLQREGGETPPSLAGKGAGGLGPTPPPSPPLQREGDETPPSFARKAAGGLGPTPPPTPPLQREGDETPPSFAGKGAGGLGFETIWLGAVLIALVTLVTFRVVMPYAFQAPTDNPASWLKFNPQWQGDMSNAQRMNAGDVDVPFGHQWADRAPLWFPFYNMVWFGLGIPLGVAAWLAWAIALWQILRETRFLLKDGVFGVLGRILDNPTLRAHLIPVAWIGITFFFHGTQWVKSVRYFLQMYPFMALMAAWLLVAAWDTAVRASAARYGADRPWTVGQSLAGLLGLLVVGGTFLYALAFTNIYTNPVTRVAASRWIYENVPTAITINLDTGAGPRKVQAALPNRFNWQTDGAVNVTPFKVPAEGKVSGLTLNFFADTRRDPDPEVVELIVARDPGGQDVVARATATANMERGGPKGVAVDAQLTQPGQDALETGRDYFLVTRAVRGAPFQSFNATLANEHWDDGIPLRLDGRDGFGIYQGIEMTNYDEDEPAKLDKLVEKMDQTDYIFMTSGRLYESIPRLPMRWPMTTRYYEIMLSHPEQLGFTRVAEFASYARLGPFVWNDDSSEEQFRVYDHPKVLIFQKQPDFNKNEVKRILGEGIAWDQIQRLWDKEATNVYNNARWRTIPLVGGLIANRLAPLKTDRPQPASPGSAALPKTDLMLSQSDWIRQRLGGTWSAIFNPASPLNTNGVLAVLAWYLAIQILGLVAFPVAFSVFRFLGDRGFFSSKILGLLLVSYGAWLIASVQRIVPFGRGLVWLVILGLLLISVVFALRYRAAIRDFVTQRRRDLIAGELIFLVLFIGFLFVRMGNPDLWHPYMGGEKPMDFAYMNAVIRAQFFPNYDPWFAGGYMNYYYYGFVMVAVMVLMTGIVPAIAYNLTIPLFFALTGLGAFAVVYNLVDRRRALPGLQIQAEQMRPGQAEQVRLASQGGLVSSPVVFGALGAVFVAVVGNLGELQLLLRGFSEISGGPGLKSNIPGLSAIANTVSGLGKLLSRDASFNFRQEWWYWNASRAIPHPPNEAVPITEFPYFTFLYGDLHAHMLTLPLTLLALALCLNIVLRPKSEWRLGTGDFGWPTALAAWGILGLTLGSLRPANTWDYPTYLAVAVGAFALQAYRLFGFSGRAVAELLWRSGLTLVLSNVLWLPYINNFATAFTSAELWQGSRTVWWSYLVVHGFFLFTLGTFTLFQIRAWLANQATLGRRAVAQRFLLQMMGILGIALFLLAVSNFGSWVIGLPLVVAAGLLLLRRPSDAVEQPSTDAARSDAMLPTQTPDFNNPAVAFIYEPSTSSMVNGQWSMVNGPSSISRPSPATTFILLMMAAAVSLTLVVDVVVLKGDISRMNTVFKFYLQVWALLGVGAAAALAWVWDELQTVNLSARTVWQTVFAFLFFAVSLYPIFATWGRVNDRFNKEVGPTLDGMAFMDMATYSDAPDGRPPANYQLKWDREAIEWMQMNIMGTPVILEAHTVEYRWGSRVSIYTGFPTIVGWSNHQRQQRSAITDRPVVDERGGEVRTLFNTPDINVANQLLQKYGVGYIYMGPTEKAYYSPEGLAKFQRMAQAGALKVVYSNQEVTIYQVLANATS